MKKGKNAWEIRILGMRMKHRCSERWNDAFALCTSEKFEKGELCVMSESSARESLPSAAFLIIPLRSRSD